MTSILIAAGVGLVLGIITLIIWFRVNARVNLLQRGANKLENRLRAAGAEWLGDLLEDAVVGDVTAFSYKVRDLVEHSDSTQFFLERIAVPIAIYAIRETRENYPDLFDKLSAEVNK